MSDLPNPADLDYTGAPPEDTGPAQTTMADLPAQLKGWLGGVGNRLQGWATDAATLVNDFITRRDIAANAQAQADQFTGNVQTFAGGLDSMVRADPTATNLALGLAALTVPAIVAEHPYLSDEQRPQVANDLAGEIGKSVARNAVVSWAQRDPDAAHAELGRLRGLFTPEEGDALAAHVDLLGDAHQMDAEAAQIAAANARADESHRRTMLYADELIKPDGSPNFNPAWARRVANDPNVSPQDTAQLLDVQRVQTRMNQLGMSGGPPPITNGNKILDFIDMAKNGREGQKALLDQVRQMNLSLKDAQTFSKASPGDLAFLENYFKAAQSSVKGADGDLDPDGTSMARFADSALNMYRTLGRGALDPNDPNFMGRMQRSFGQDALDRRIAQEQKAQKIEDIFARRQAMRQAEAQKRGEEFGLKRQLAAVDKERALSERNAIHDERVKAREQRMELRGQQMLSRAQAAANSANVQLAQRNEARQIAQGNAIADRASRERGRPPANPADTFRKFWQLGRPERV